MAKQTTAISKEEQDQIRAAKALELAKEQEQQEQTQPKIDAAALIAAATGDMLNDWFTRGVKCKFVNFHQPVPRIEDHQPSNEFRIPIQLSAKGVPQRYDKRTKSWQDVSATDMKYYVDAIAYTPFGLIWKSGDEMNIVPLANVGYVRPL